MKVYQLKEIFASYLDILDNYEDEMEVKLQSNTYFLGHPHYFLGISGMSDGGYLNLDNLEENIITDNEE